MFVYFLSRHVQRLNIIILIYCMDDIIMLLVIILLYSSRGFFFVHLSEIMTIVYALIILISHQ